VERFLLRVTYVIEGCLLRRCHDTDAHVRRDAVIAVISILKSPAVDVSSMSTLVDCVKERLRDIRVIKTAWIIKLLPVLSLATNTNVDFWITDLSKEIGDCLNDIFYRSMPFLILRWQCKGQTLLASSVITPALVLNLCTCVTLTEN